MSKQNRLERWIAVLMLGAASVISAAPAHRHSPDLEDLKNSNESVDVIIQFTQTPTARHHDKVRAHGGSLRVNLDLVKAGAYTVQASEIESLSAEPEVVYISPDRKVTGSLDLTAAAVNAPQVWQNYGLNGSGIGVAVIDSGFSTFSDDLNNWTPSAPGTYGVATSRIVYSKTFVGGGTADAYGHGTHVAGIVGGNGYDSVGVSMGNTAYTKTFRGIAPGVSFINFRVLDKNGAGTDSAVIAAINEAIRVKNTYNIRVINLSLGRPCSKATRKIPSARRLRPLGMRASSW